MEASVADKSVVLVTGGTRGLGKVIAEAFGAAGSAVVVCSRTPPAGHHIGQAAKSTAAVMTADVSRPGAVDDVIERVVEEYGRLDVVVLNAGGTHRVAPIVDLSDGEWDSTIALNLNHVFWGMRAALKRMIPQRSGRIVAVCAPESKLPHAGASGYVAAKHAVAGLVKSVAHEVGTLGITVNGVMPGLLDPVVSAESDAAAIQLAERRLIGSATSPADVAAAVLMLTAPSMSSVTGCLFPVDGGTVPY